MRPADASWEKPKINGRVGRIESPTIRIICRPLGGLEAQIRQCGRGGAVKTQAIFGSLRVHVLKFFQHVGNWGIALADMGVEFGQSFVSLVNVPEEREQPGQLTFVGWNGYV